MKPCESCPDVVVVVVVVVVIDEKVDGTVDERSRAAVR